MNHEMPIIFLLLVVGIIFSTQCVHAQSGAYPIGIIADGVEFTGPDSIFCTENPTLTGCTFQNYVTNTTSVLGTAQINSISVRPPAAGASLQLNAILHVITTNGSGDYFIQNVLQINNTDGRIARFLDNVWNLSNPQDSSSICAFAIQSCFISQNQKYYAKVSDPFTYALPYTTSLAIAEDVVPNQYVEIRFIDNEYGNTNLFDHYYLSIPNVMSASFLINTDNVSHTYDYAALVWAGHDNYSSAYFTSMDSILDLYYYDSSNISTQGSSQPYLINPWKPFPGYSSFGSVTGETAQDIYSIIEPNKPGSALVLLDPTYTVISSHPITKIEKQIVPEFGTLSSWVLLIGFITILAISSKLRSETT